MFSKYVFKTSLKTIIPSRFTHSFWLVYLWISLNLEQEFSMSLVLRCLYSHKNTEELLFMCHVCVRNWNWKLLEMQECVAAYSIICYTVISSHLLQFLESSIVHSWEVGAKKAENLVVLLWNSFDLANPLKESWGLGPHFEGHTADLE